MPFRTDDDEPLEELLLAQRPANGYRFELRAPVVYVDPVSGRRYRAPARDEASGSHGVTDLASVPTPLWGFIASYGRQSAPAVLHDEQSLRADELGDRRASLVARREDDRVFRTALREQGVPRLRALLMWAWVSADREIAYGAVPGRLLLAQVALGVVALVAAVVFAVVQPWWLAVALLLAPALAALWWGGLARLVIALTYPLALFGPLFLVQLAAIVLFRLVEAIVELVAGGDPRDVVLPTVAGPGRRGAREPERGDVQG